MALIGCESCIATVITSRLSFVVGFVLHFHSKPATNSGQLPSQQCQEAPQDADASTVKTPSVSGVPSSDYYIADWPGCYSSRGIYGQKLNQLCLQWVKQQVEHSDVMQTCENLSLYLCPTTGIESNAQGGRFSKEENGGTICTIKETQSWAFSKCRFPSTLHFADFDSFPAELLLIVVQHCYLVQEDDVLCACRIWLMVMMQMKRTMVTRLLLALRLPPSPSPRPRRQTSRRL